MLEAAERRDGDVLRLWLTLLGWQVELERDGALVVGVARHLGADGSMHSVGACAPSESEAVWQLFAAALERGAASRVVPAADAGAQAAA